MSALCYVANRQNLAPVNTLDLLSPIAREKDGESIVYSAPTNVRVETHVFSINLKHVHSPYGNVICKQQRYDRMEGMGWLVTESRPCLRWVRLQRGTLKLFWMTVT